MIKLVTGQRRTDYSELMFHLPCNRICFKVGKLGMIDLNDSYESNLMVEAGSLSHNRAPL